MEDEIWKDIDGFEGLYAVSNLGRVKRISNTKKEDKILSLRVNTGGYNHVVLCKNGKGHTKIVHRLVYETFFGKTKLIIDHIIEGNKLDNRLSNLQAITTRENSSKHRMSIKKTSKYTGVCWDKEKGKWVSQIVLNGKNKHLGRFEKEEDARVAYEKALENHIKNNKK